MAINQITVLIQDKGSALTKAVSVLAQANINICALSVADTNAYGILRLIVDDTEKSLEVLKQTDHIIQKTPVLALSISDEPGSFQKVLDACANAEISINYFYSFIRTKGTHAAIVINVDDIITAEKICNEKGITIITEEDIKSIDKD